eukprot:scaffold23504_cov32-Tisochrysis_lutea.AAC.3
MVPCYPIVKRPSHAAVVHVCDARRNGTDRRAYWLLVLHLARGEGLLYLLQDCVQFALARVNRQHVTRGGIPLEYPCSSPELISNLSAMHGPRA